MNLGGKDGIMTVSYTHLDVYKRQPPTLQSCAKPAKTSKQRSVPVKIDRMNCIVPLEKYGNIWII